MERDLAKEVEDGFNTIADKLGAVMAQNKKEMVELRAEVKDLRAEVDALRSMRSASAPPDVA